MARGFVVLLCLASIGRAETLDEAVRVLAKKIAVHLAPGETARITGRNLSSLGAAEASRARALLERALRRPARRAIQPAQIEFTIAENVRGYLLVADLRRGEERFVAMTGYRPDPAARRAGLSLEQKLLWEQDSPILDVAVAGDSMLVLDPLQLTAYRRGAAGWERLQSQSVSPPAPAVRDPRGRLEVSGDSLTAYLPGAACRGTWNPALQLECDAASAEFSLGDVRVRFTPARNTLEANGRPPFYSFARVEEGARPLYLAAETDGRTHLYDADNKPAGALDDWESDFQPISGPCVASPRVLAAAENRLTVYEIADRKPLPASEPEELPGPVTALWPAAGGTLAVVHNLATGRYAAYHITLDCGR